MLRKGIRILDTINHAVSVNLGEILNEVPQGNTLTWSILFIAGLGLYRGKPLPDLELEVKNLSKGILTNWEDLKYLTEVDENIEDLILIGSKDDHYLRKYMTDQEMFESCDFTIVFFDSCFWEVFSKDEAFINRLAAKFKKTTFIMSDFQKEYELDR